MLRVTDRLPSHASARSAVRIRDPRSVSAGEKALVFQVIRCAYLLFWLAGVKMQMLVLGSDQDGFSKGGAFSSASK